MNTALNDDVATNGAMQAFKKSRFNHFYARRAEIMIIALKLNVTAIRSQRSTIISGHNYCRLICTINCG
jgi:hypothetical protein